MATYWIDPFLEATTQGAGTTDTTTKDGTYAAPFSITQFVDTSTTNVSSINGVTLSDGDELRMKGIAFGTLFESHGNVFPATNAYSNGLVAKEDQPYLRPVTGNTSFDATISDSKSCIFAFQNSDISTYVPGWSHPLFFSSEYGSGSSFLHTMIGAFLFPVVYTEMGHTSASSTGIELFRVKDTYANRLSWSGHHYAFDLSVKVTLSAGWTSETEQNGFSIWETYGTSNFRYLYVSSRSSNKLKWDCERLIFSMSNGGSGASFQASYFRLDQAYSRLEQTDHVTPIYAMSIYYFIDIRAGRRGGDTTTIPMFTGGADGYYNTGSRFGLLSTTGGSGNATTTLNNYIGGTNAIHFSYFGTDHDFKLGNSYSNSHYFDSGFGAGFRIFNYAAEFVGTGNTGSVTFLQNKVYYTMTTVTSPTADSIFDNNGGPVVYESGIKRPGIAPLANVTRDAHVGPDRGPSESSFALFKKEKEVSSSADWFSASFQRPDDLNEPIIYTSIGKWTTGGANYKTSAHSVGTYTNTALSATVAPQFLILTGEHNDYDGKPLSMLGNPYTAGLTYGSLLYNDTISSTDVLVAQWAAYAGSASTQTWLPLDLAVPSYTAGSDDLRAKVVVAYADGNDNSAAGSILLRAWHRDTTQSDNFRVYSSSATAVSAGGDPTSPTTVTLNLSNVATSGQDDITTVCLGIAFNFTDNTNVQKYYVVSADIETY